MQIPPFEMERWQSLHEHSVEINLSDSGVHPLTVSELVEDPGERARLLETRLGYTQTNGTGPLRAAIASLYAGASPENVLVTTGGIEANFLSIWRLVEPGDEVVVMAPNYQQVEGVAAGFGATVIPWRLRADFAAGRWRAEPGALERLVTPRTKLIAVCNPNNPTGATFGADTLDAVAAVAARVGAWVLSDEIYQGSEYEGAATPSAWGRCDRALVTNSLSKAYGLPGLRLGWVLGPAATIEALWGHHDYTTIAPTALSDALACAALRPARRARLLARGRRMLSENYATVAAWLASRADRMRAIPPRAGGMLWLRYAHEIGSTELAERLRVEERVLLVPGDQYGMDGWLRIGFGGEPAHVIEGLARLDRLLDRLSS